LGLFFSIAVYALLLGGVFKLFQIANDLGEIKDALLDIRRNLHDPLSPAPPLPQSAENLLRAVSAQGYPPVESEIDSKR
jgi:hypothetical protein